MLANEQDDTVVVGEHAAFRRKLDDVKRRRSGVGGKGVWDTLPDVQHGATTDDLGRKIFTAIQVARTAKAAVEAARLQQVLDRGSHGVADAATAPAAITKAL